MHCRSGCEEPSRTGKWLEFSVSLDCILHSSRYGEETDEIRKLANLVFNVEYCSEEWKSETNASLWALEISEDGGINWGETLDLPLQGGRYSKTFGREPFFRIEFLHFRSWSLFENLVAGYRGRRNTWETRSGTKEWLSLFSIKGTSKFSVIFKGINKRHKINLKRVASQFKIWSNRWIQKGGN